MSDYQVVTLKGDKKLQFEVLTKPGTVLKYREGKLGIDNVLFSDDVFTNHKKGDKAKITELQATFGTDNTMKCITTILEKGEYHISSAERKEKVDKKRKEIVNYIHKYYTDPRTKTPHPVVRIESALEKIKFNIDINAPAEKQVQDIYKQLVEQIPLKKSEVEAELKLKHQYLGSTMSLVKKWANVLSDSYNNVGVTMHIAVVPGDYDQFIKELEKATKGDYELNIIGTPASSGAAASSAAPNAASKKGGKKGKGKK